MEIREGREECVQDDGDDEDDEDEDCVDERTSLKVTEKRGDGQQRRNGHRHQSNEGSAIAADAADAALLQLQKRRASLKRNHTDDTDVERRMARIYHEIDYSVDSVEDSAKFITTSHSSGEAPAMAPADDGGAAVQRVEVETQTTVDDEQVRQSLRCYCCCSFVRTQDNTYQSINQSN